MAGAVRWKCDKCGFRWIKGEIWPERCASSKCRKRSFNKTGSGEESQTHQETAVGVRLPEPSDNRENSASPTIQSLRDICGGKIPVSSSTDPYIEPISVPMCPYKEWSDGEQYACGLPIHSAKVKHTRGGAL